MKESKVKATTNMYVIATRSRGNKEIYLAIDESKNNLDKPYQIYFKWTEDIEEAYATFTYTDVEETAKRHFKNYSKWYIKEFNAKFY